MIELIEARQDDSANLAALHQHCFAEGWTAGTFEALFAQPGIFALLARHEGENVGFVLARVAADEGEILSIGVGAGSRQCGLGARLLAAAAGLAFKVGAGKMFLEVGADNQPALRLYRKLGFHEVGRRRGYYANGQEDALTMHCDLPLPGLGIATELD
jgi:ribosomal-protein-alanine N-acetyltransferase